MKIEDLHIGMQVTHPQYGTGTVKTISAHTAEIEFFGGIQTVSPEVSRLEPAEVQAQVTGLTRPLAHLVREIVAEAVHELGVEMPDATVEDLANRWRNGTLILRPSDPNLQPKEVPLETFFHKIVMMRNNFRVLEQKINSHAGLSDAEKVDMQQYITRCYGSMTTFNILFKNERDQFRSK